MSKPSVIEQNTELLCSVHGPNNSWPGNQKGTMLTEKEQLYEGDRLFF